VGCFEHGNGPLDLIKFETHLLNLSNFWVLKKDSESISRQYVIENTNDPSQADRLIWAPGSWEGKGISLSLGYFVRK
jgi:hypothetical protein